MSDEDEAKQRNRAWGLTIGISIITVVYFTSFLHSYFQNDSDKWLGFWFFYLILILFFMLLSFTGFRGVYQTLQLQHPYWYIFLVYLSFFNLSLVIFNLNLPYFSPCAISNNFLLSTLQIQVTILTILVSISLLAIQYLATTYSVRFGDLFKSWEEWKIFFAIFLISTLLTFSLVIHNKPAIFSKEIEVILFIFSFLLILPFFWDSITILRADNVIQYLTYKIPKTKSIFSFKIFTQLFFDIFRYSLDKRDYIMIDSVLVNITKLQEESQKIKTGPEGVERIKDLNSHIKRIKEKYEMDMDGKIRKDIMDIVEFQQ